MKGLATSVTLLLLLILSLDQLRANPIVHHRQGKNGRAEYVHAVIRPLHLHTGQPTSADTKLAKQIRSLGKPGDDCGHIAANVLGGPMVAYNLFPQNLSKNRGEFKNTVEAHMQKFLEMDKENRNSRYEVDYHATLIYANDSDTRPTQLRFDIRFYKDSKLVSHEDIPVSGKHRVPANPYVGVVLNPIYIKPNTTSHSLLFFSDFKFRFPNIFNDEISVRHL